MSTKKAVQALREKSVADLKGEVVNLAKDEFKLRMQKATGQLPKSHLVKQTRRQIARIKTILTQKTEGAKV